MTNDFVEQSDVQIQYQREVEFLTKINKILSGMKSISVQNLGNSSNLAFCDIRRKDIHINLQKISTETASYEQYFSIIKGMNYHELSHILFTQHTLNTYMNSTQRQVCGMLEDVAIENKFGAMYPKAFLYFRNSVMKFILEQAEANKKRGKITPPENYLLVYGRRIFLDKKKVAFFRKIFLDKYGKADTKTIEDLSNEYILCLNVTRKIQIVEEIARIISLVNQKQQQQQNGQSQSSSRSSNETDFAQQDSHTQKPSSSSYGNLKKDSKIKTEQQKKIIEKIKKMMEQKDSEKVKTDKTETVEDVTKAIEEELIKINDKIQKDVKDEIKIVKNNDLYDGNSKDYSQDGTSSGHTYQTFNPTSRDKITSKRLETIIRKWKTETKATYQTNQLSGRLDVRKAMEFGKTYDTRLFKNYKGDTSKESKMLVSILLDESGSVDRKQFETEVALTWTLTNALENTGSKVMVQGFSDKTVRIKSFDNKKGSWIRTMGDGTRPEDAIESGAKIMKNYSLQNGIKNKYMIIITDGQYTLQNDFIATKVKRFGIKTLEILVGGFRQSYVEEHQKIYDKIITVTKFEEIEKKLSTYIKEEQSALIKTRGR